jgi:hypothetical protein
MVPPVKAFEPSVADVRINGQYHHGGRAECPERPPRSATHDTDDGRRAR